MSEVEDQMGLFEATLVAAAVPERQPQPSIPARQPEPAIPARQPKPAPPSSAGPRPAARRAPPVKTMASAPPPRKVSGLVPQGDVRLTANIRQDLHLKLKISSAHRRTTIGEILEELIEKHL